LVGEAGKICMDLNLQPTSFTKYLLELCNIKVNSLKNFIIPQKELENVCHCLKNILKDCRLLERQYSTKRKSRQTKDIQKIKNKFRI
jgi:hypothetical protein